MMICGSLAGAIPQVDKSTKLEGQKNVDRTYSHTILGEYGTRAGCVPCYYAHTALKKIYANGWYPLYYITLVYKILLI